MGEETEAKTTMLCQTVAFSVLQFISDHENYCKTVCGVYSDVGNTFPKNCSKAKTVFDVIFYLRPSCNGVFANGCRQGFNLARQILDLVVVGLEDFCDSVECAILCNFC